MGRRFRGEYTFKVDTKGRVSIPASFRRVLEAGDPGYTEGLRPQFVIQYGDDSQKYLEVFTMAEIEKLEDKIERLPNSPLKRELIHSITSRSHESEIDPDGRFVLPAKLRDHVGLGKEAVFAGTLNTFQIWDPEEYARRGDGKEQDAVLDLPEGINPMDAMDMVLAKLERE
ncbi:division/cell wall cluster transcriptional repressor MraZ [Seohaeicola saemankumensis]|nr:division/cell wall cluster transcriptional repressor MraZ [Seohaeicola saemankumensis]MCA0871621.1 division/cell wall cluster transcriptional repressor MraZ [Seohaeicola saemankumensis]